MERADLSQKPGIKLPPEAADAASGGSFLQDVPLLPTPCARMPSGCARSPCARLWEACAGLGAALWKKCRNSFLAAWDI